MLNKQKCTTFYGHTYYNIHLYNNNKNNKIPINKDE